MLEKPFPETTKEQVAEIASEAIKTGDLIIPYPSGCENYIGRKTIRVTYVSDPRHYWEFFPSRDLKDFDEKAKRFLEEANKGISDLGDYLSERGLGGYDEFDLQIRIPNNEDELRVPKLSSFDEDDRIFVYLLKDFGTEWDVGGNCTLEEILVSFDWQIIRRAGQNLEIFQKCGIEKAEYEERGSYMLLFRYPVLFNVNFYRKEDRRVHRYADLAGVVLLNHLNHFTIDHIWHDFDAIGGIVKKISQSQVDDVVNKRTYEEMTLTRGIVLDWLLETQQRTGFNGDEIIGLFANIQNKDHLTSLEQIRRKGIQEVFEFYKSDEWSFESYLKEDF